MKKIIRLGIKKNSAKDVYSKEEILEAIERIENLSEEDLEESKNPKNESLSTYFRGRGSGYMLAANALRLILDLEKGNMLD